MDSYTVVLEAEASGRCPLNGMFSGQQAVAAKNRERQLPNRGESAECPTSRSEICESFPDNAVLPEKWIFLKENVATL